METYAIYRILNTINGKLYIGQTKNTTRRKRTHQNKSHNQHLENAKQKYGHESFIFEIIEENLSQEQADEREQFWIYHLNTQDPSKGYNKNSGGRSGRACSAETRRKISEAKKGIDTLSLEQRQRIVEILKSLPRGPLSEETKRKISDANKGRQSKYKGVPRSEDTKKKMSEALRGRTSSMAGKSHTDHTKKKMSEARKGKPSHRKGVATSEETKRKISDANKGRQSKYKGVPRNQQVKAKISAAKRKPIQLNGIVYESVLDAALKLGVSKYRIKQLLLLQLL